MTEPVTPDLPLRPATADTMAAGRSALDTGDGLQRIMGDRVLYAKLLWRFQHDYQHCINQFQSAITAGQYAGARLKAHTLKGAAGMIGAQQVQHLAGELEAALRAQAPPPQLQPQLQPLAQAMQLLLTAIRAQLPPPDDVPATPATDGAATLNAADPATLVLIGRLAYFLQEGDGAAIDVLENSATVLAATLGLAVFQEVATAAHEFDFDGALLALRQRR